MDDHHPLELPAADGGYVTRTDELLSLLSLDPALPQLEAQRLRSFRLRVPRSYVARMRHGDPDDPLFLQVWPAAREADIVPGYAADAVGELERRGDGGLIRKYRGRALLIATGACPIHCRYCFRRHFPYGESLAGDGWQAALDALAADRSIDEIILSGGDPLTLPDTKLARLVERLQQIPHLKRLRIHTRVPIVEPERVGAALTAWLGGSRLQPVVVVHCNHPAEIDANVGAALRRLRAAGATLLNQAVLLRRINDDADTLVRLSETLFARGVLPYYLHCLDRVQGAAHFDVNGERAEQLMRELAARLPGYLLPRLVREVSGAPAKVQLPW